MLYDNVSVSTPNQLAIEICSSLTLVHACGQTVQFIALVGTSHHKCSNAIVIEAHAHHFIRPPIVQSGEEIQLGMVMHVFDSLLELHELAQICADRVHIGPLSVDRS